MRFKEFLKNILLTFISISLFFLFLEIGLRTIDKKALPELNEARWENVFKFYEYDQLLGWRNKAGSEGIFQTPDTKTFVTINSKGLRDVEHNYDREDRFRILVLGDSFVWGYGVEQDRRFTDFLQKLLGDKVEIINAGVSGYGTDQELLYYKTEGVKYSPDLVILAFGSFDAKHDNMQAVTYTYPKPYFILEKGILSLKNVPVPTREYEWQETEELERMYREEDRATRKVPLSKKIRKFLRKKFKTYSFISDGIKNIRTKARDSLKENPKILDYMVRKKSKKKKDDYFILTKMLVKELNKTVISNGARMAVLMEPYRSHLKKLPDSIYSNMIEFCQSEGILCLDPYTRLFNSYKQKEKLYFDHDEHWNETAHRLVAEEIYANLVKIKLIR